jgi:hypothetical protein
MPVTVRFLGVSEKTYQDAEVVCLEGALIILSKWNPERRHTDQICAFPADQVLSADVSKDGVVTGRVLGTGGAQVA